MKNLICLALAGGLGTEIVYGSSYGMSGDEKVIDLVGAELIRRNDNSLLDRILLYTKDLSIFSMRDFNSKIKEFIL